MNEELRNRKTNKWLLFTIKTEKKYRNICKKCSLPGGAVL